MRKLLFVLVVCAAASMVWAEEAPTTLQWFGANCALGAPPSTTDWATAWAWKDEFTNLPSTHAPRAVDRIKINQVWGLPGPVVDEEAQGGEIFIAEADASIPLGFLTVTDGGNLVTGSPGGVPWLGQVNIGYGAHNTGTLTMEGGSMTVTQHLWLGWNGKGILQMNGGTLNVNGMFAPGAGTTFGGNPLATGSAEIHLDGGLLHLAQWWYGAGFGGVHNYTFDITEGTLELHGFWTDAMQELKDNGWITGYGDADNVQIAWDPVNELTVVTAIPEPISISLLGLGALALLRKRS